MEKGVKVTQMMIFVFDKTRKHFGKRTKWWLPEFSYLPTIFSKGIFCGSLKPWIEW